MPRMPRGTVRSAEPIGLQLRLHLGSTTLLTKSHNLDELLMDY